MKPETSRRLIAAATILGCVLIALGFATPTIYYCQREGARLVCQWSFNRHGATDDWRYFAEAWEAARVALMDFGQFPSWNPYHCGGLVLYQDPQSPFPGPLFLLTFFWLPAAAAMKVWVIAHLIAGALGARWLVKDMGGNAPEQLFGAALVTACGFSAWHIGGGHLSFTPFLFLPWLLFAQRRALRDPRWAVLVASILAVCFYEGATYPLPLMLVALGVDALARLGSRDERRAMYVSLPIVGVLFPLLAGARLLPVLAYLREHPRLVPLDDSMTVAEVFQTWLVRKHERPFAGHVYVWNEYGDYIGLLSVLIMLVGVVVALVRRDDQSRARRIDLVLMTVLIWCALGNIPGFSLFGLLHELPIYRSLRVPARFLGPATVALSLVCVWALMTARRVAAEVRARPWLLRAFVGLELALALGVAVDMSVTNAEVIQMGIDPEIPRARASTAFWQNTSTDYSRLATHPVRGIGTRQCYVPLEWGPAPGLRDGQVPQAWIEGESAGSVEQTRWSPNELSYRVRLEGPATLVVNQNYETGWRASKGRVGAWIAARRALWYPPVQRDPEHPAPEVGMLAVDLPAGSYTVTLRHQPPGLAAGLAAMALGIVLALLALWKLTPTRVQAIRAWIARTLTTSQESGG